MAGVSLHRFPYFKRPAAQPVSGPPHFFKWSSPATSSVQWAGDTAQARLPAPPSSGAGLLPATLAGPSDPAHLLSGVQTVEQGKSYCLESGGAATGYFSLISLALLVYILLLAMHMSVCMSAQ